MPVTLDHTIVHARDNLASARFLADILGIDGPVGPGHFAPVVTDNDVVLDFMVVGHVMPHHYAFHASPTEFDAAYARVLARGLAIYAAPDRSGEGELYRHNGQRGFYFDDPDRNLMELIEQPVGVGDEEIALLATRWAAAEVDGDVGALGALLDPGFCGVGPLGFVLDKTAWLGRFAGGLQYQTLSFENLRVSEHGDAAIVVGALAQQATFNGSDTSGRFRVSFVAVRSAGRLRIASCHIGPLDARAEAS